MGIRPSCSDDRRLLGEALKGNKAAFESLWTRYQDVLLHMATRMTHDEASARDLVQETCLRVYLGMRSLRRPDLFRSWSIGILINTYREWLRSRENQHLSIDSPADLTGGHQFLETSRDKLTAADPTVIFDDRELKRLVLESVMKLPVGLRKPALLFYFEGMSVKECAAALGVTPQALKMRLSRARTSLRRRLGQART